VRQRYCLQVANATLWLEGDESVINLVGRYFPRSITVLRGIEKPCSGVPFAEVLQKFAVGGAMSGVVEIAEKAGVSPATVSRALRGLHHVNEKTRKRIIDVARELEYPIRPDLLPAGVSGKTNTIGVIAPYISRWYFSQAIAGIEQALREAGLDLLLYNFAQIDARKRVFQQNKLVGKVDGLIVISLPPTEKEFEKILGLGIPVSLLGVPTDLCSYVSIDDIHGGEIATQHLIDMGHREIALMLGQREIDFDFEVASNREEGFMKALQKNDIEFNPRNLVTANFDSRTAELAMDEFLTRRKLPSAIFCESDEMAFGVYRSLQKRGMRVPEDFSIVGFDDHEFAQTLGLTTIAQPVRFLGQLAASQVMSRIDKKAENVASHMTVPLELVIRKSVLKIN
jgi:DNA-binding LacI/PurR family transcriptional regulator